MRIVLALVGNAIALWATTFVPGIVWRGDILALLVAGLVLGLFNLIVKPVAVLLSLPLLILTLGLFYFVLNGILLWVFSLFIPNYTVNGLVPAILGALVLGLVNWAFGALTGTSD
jgi:putative membrane protein